MQPDLHEAAPFLSGLTWGSGWNTPHTFFATDDRKRDPSLTRTLHGRLTEHADELVYLNQKGAGIFVTVNQTDGRGRRSENILAPRALFIDVDGPLSRRLALFVSMTVTTRNGQHVYWCLNRGEALAAFTPAQRQLARFYGSDPTVCDLPRVMRLPGFAHQKAEPFMVRIGFFEPQKTYSIEEVVAAHPVQVETPVRPVTTKNGNYAKWAQCHEAVDGTRNKTAFSIAAEGFRRGLPEEEVSAVVTAWASLAGIGAEAPTILRSARRYHEKRAS